MLCNFALFNDDIIGVRGTWPYMRLGIVNSVGTDGRPPAAAAHMGLFKNREKLCVCVCVCVCEGERECVCRYVCERERHSMCVCLRR